MPTAIGVGVGLGLVVLGSLYVVKEAFVAFAAVVVVAAVTELSAALASRGIRVPLVPTVVGSLGMLVSAYASGPEALVVAFALTSGAILAWRLVEGVSGAARDIAAGVFTCAYLPLLAGFAMLMLSREDGPSRIVVFIAVVVCSDVGGYAAGVAFGRHPMAPSVSPKKSWEGLAGSAVACAAGGTAVVPLLLGGPWWAGLALGLAGVLTATLGDLSESMLKRDLGIKDMGALLPGHGGVMDRLDSLLLTAPVAWLLLETLV